MTDDSPCVCGCGQDAATIERLLERLAKVERALDFLDVAARIEDQADQPRAAKVLREATAAVRAALTPQSPPQDASHAPEAPGQPGGAERGADGRTGVVRVKIDNEDDLLPEYRTGYQFPYLDEFVANAVNVHFEAMSQSQFWIGIDDPATGRSWAINCGATNGRAKGYAFVEED